MTAKKIQITELALRDGHQSLLATRMRIDDMLPIADKIDAVGFWSAESWGGATFDSCIRFLGEDPWDRIRELKKAMPNTRQQMLLRGQNLLGYRHYADDLVTKFIERACKNGVDVFRIFDALNDNRNLQTAIDAVKANGGHAQGTLSFTVSPLHNQQYWLDLACAQQDMGIDSLAIKDMSGLLTPAQAYDMVSRLKQSIDVPIHLHCHATTGLSTPTFYKAVEAGVDVLDTAISSLSQTYSHSATETIVAMLADTPWHTDLDMHLLEEIAIYFREVRKKYARFEGSLKGIDSRILIAQVPGGMLTNLEQQLKEQQALDKFDQVLEEIAQVRQDLGYLPLVTPTSQIVGTQAVLNVLAGEPYANMSKETQALIRGEYGATPTAVRADLIKKVLGDKTPISHRPADDLTPEFDSLSQELQSLAQEQSLQLADTIDDDVLTYALFPQQAVYFFKNRNTPDAFESITDEQPAKAQTDSGSYQVKVDNDWYQVEVVPDGAVIRSSQQATQPAVSTATSETAIRSPMAGVIVDLLIQQNATVRDGDPLCILEAMKMETEIKAPRSGTVTALLVKAGDQVQAGQVLVQLQ